MIIRNNLRKRHQILSEFWFSPKCQFYAKTYELISTDEESVVNKHCSDIDTKFEVGITESQEKFPRFIGYHNFINDLITKLVSSQTLA